MPKPSHALHQVLHAQKLLGEHLLHSLINIMQEHVRHTRSFPVPCHHCCREYRRHPPRCLWEPSTRHIDHYQIPLSVEYSVAIGIEGTPHEGVVAEFEGEEITGRSFLEARASCENAFHGQKEAAETSPGTIPTAYDEKKPHEGPLQPRLSLKESRVIRCDAKSPSRLSRPPNPATTQSLLLTGLWLPNDTSRTEVLLPANGRCRSLPSDLSTVDLSDPSKFEPLSSSAQLSRSVVREDEIIGRDDDKAPLPKLTREVGVFFASFC
ncbi:hypothetical protein V6N11_078912 [Hibiscus sabdariffa]|uniref:Uncharacterized protein n=1 Tax=Hibiscus sabdariffa TaxID=183260 RepID=A0ABR2RU39_9ROSI